MKSDKPAIQFPRLVKPETPLEEDETTAEDEAAEAAVAPHLFNSPASVVMTATGMILFTLVLLVVWAAFAPLHRGTVAPGAVQALGQRNVIQQLDGGVVQTIYVHEGDKVKAGQLLIQIDDRAATYALQLLQQQQRLLTIEQSMLNAERSGRSTIEWPPEILAVANDPAIATAMRTNAAALAARAAQRAAQKGVLKQENERLEAHILGLQAQKEGVIEQNRLIQDELAGVQTLYEKGLVPKTRLLALQRNAADLKGNAGAADAGISQDRVTMDENNLRALAVDTQMQQDDTKRLTDLQQNLFELNDRILSAQLVLARTKIYAPQDGIVLNRAVSSAGQVIRPGEPIMEIVPNDKLIISAKVRPQDVEHVHVGAAATVKLTGLNIQTAPRLHGTVTYISADALSDKDGKISYYQARVEVPDFERRKVGRFALTPGMPAEVMIDAGARTALDYLLQPVAGAYGHAFHE